MYTSVKNVMCKTRIQTPVKPSQEKKFKWPVQFNVRKESRDAEADLVLQASLVSQDLREIVVGLVPQASMVRLGPRDHRDLKVLREIRGLLDRGAIRALKGDPGESISAPSIVTSPVSTVVNETDVASLQCEVKGNPVPQITWLKENTSLPADKRIVQSRGGLMIKDVTSQDGAVYTCVASNILGLIKKSATLTVQGNMLLLCYILENSGIRSSLLMRNQIPLHNILSP